VPFDDENRIANAAGSVSSGISSSNPLKRGGRSIHSAIAFCLTRVEWQEYTFLRPGSERLNRNDSIFALVGTGSGLSAATQAYASHARMQPLSPAEKNSCIDEIARLIVGPGPSANQLAGYYELPLYRQSFLPQSQSENAYFGFASLSGLLRTRSNSFLKYSYLHGGYSAYNAERTRSK
jgi:hypothetical protein